MDFQSLSPRKKAFIIVGGIAVILLIYGMIKLSGGAASGGGKRAPVVKELSVWVVGDETAGYSDIITAFKAKNQQYANTDIRFTKFASYADYEQALLNVMADGNGPDIFVVNNNGGTLLENKMIAIPGSVINTDDFSKRFARVFDELILSNKEKNEKGDEITVRYLKGVPLGYETLGVFYNWRIIKNMPTTWSDIDKELQSNSGSESEGSLLGIGMDGKYVQNASDLLTLLFLQNGVNSYTKLSDLGANNALITYTSYATPESMNNLSQFKDQMDTLGLTTTDLFVRGKIAAIIGYPSLLREIEFSIKRAAGEVAIGDKFLRTSEVPQMFDLKDKMTNLVNYSFFALSKFSKNPEAAQAFIAFLATPGAQEKFLKNFPYYLPAQTAFESDRLSQSMNKMFERAQYQSFLREGVNLSSFDKGLKTSYDSYFYRSIGMMMDTRKILANATKYITCNVNHFVNNTGFDEECR